MGRGVARRWAVAMVVVLLSGLLPTAASARIVSVDRAPTPSAGPSAVQPSGATEPSLPEAGAAPEPTVVVPFQGTGYRYKVYPRGGGPADFYTESFDDAAFATDGRGAFASGGSCAIQASRGTTWPANTDILIRRPIELPAGTTSVVITGGIDNDVFLYWNGNLVLPKTHEGCASRDEFTVAIPDDWIKAGTNLLAARGRDRGVESWFDVEVSAILHPATPPVAMAGGDQQVIEGAVVTLDGTGSSDPDGAPLTFSWSLTDRTGPPIALSTSTSATPSFATIDDGVYRFRLTVSDGTDTATDDVVVTVANANPTIAATADPAYAKSVALVTTSFSDAGVIDTHTGTLDWGDGSAHETLPAVVDGAGWGTLVATHVYTAAGSYPVTVTVTDDDGGTATTTVAALQVGTPVALWANSSSSDAAMESTSGSIRVEGLTHTNDDLRIRGGAKTFVGPTEYVRTLDVGGAGATFDPAARKVPIAPFPITFDLATYRPGGKAAIAAGPAYHDMSGQCGASGTWDANGGTLASGVYYVSCGVHLTGAPMGGTITLAAEGPIQVSGTAAFFDPYTDGLLFLSGSSSSSAIRIDASNSTFFGYSFARTGRIVLAGSSNRLFCGVLADRIDIAAQDLLVRGSACSTPARTVIAPVIVPSLSLGLTVDKADAEPGTALAHEARIANDGATLVVPGILALENLGTAQATVTGHELALEYLAADGTWTAVPGTITTTIRPNPFAGVAYPAAGEQIDGTTIAAGALASFGYAAVVTLDADQTALLLDPARVQAIRVRSVFTLDPPTVPVRRLFRFGDDLAGGIRAQGATATDLAISILPPAGDGRTFTEVDKPGLASLAPGEHVTVTLDSKVPVPAPRSAGESDAAYLARLGNLDDTPLVGIAYARGTATVGTILAPGATVTTTRHIPVLGLAVSGPADLEPGSTAAYSLTLRNAGSAPARSIALSDSIVGGPNLTVTDAPAALAPDATAVAHASYAVPASMAALSITDTGSVNWSDTAGNPYGPVADAFSTRLIAPRKLLVTKSDYGHDAGGQFVIDYDIAITNTGAQPITGATLADPLDPYTTLVPGSVRTTQGSIADGSDVAVDLGTIASGQSVSVGFSVTVIAPVPEGIGGVRNQATISSAELDPVLSDDPELPGVIDPTFTGVFGTGGGSGGGGGTEYAHPVIGTVAPADGTVVTEPLALSVPIAPADGFDLSSWAITARPAGATGGERTLAAAMVDAPGPATATATFDPTLLPNGTWLVTVSAVGSDGGVSTATTSLIVDGNLKLGRFTTTYQDLSVGVGGLPMRVLRTYDSFDKTVGDFGVGWRLELASFRVQVNRPLGYGGWVQELINCGVFCTTTYRSTTPHVATVVWPDGHQEIFDMTPKNGSTFFGALTQAAFTGRARATSKLEALDVNLTWTGDGNLYGGGFGSAGVYDPTRFRLTAKDGTVYLLDRSAGLVSATTRTGDTLTVTPNGVTSSRGPSITFHRDPAGRIDTITGPDASSLRYAYSPVGDLASSTDQAGRTVSYEYDGDHNLKLTKDPLNRPFQTLEYHPDGRLWKVTDGEGNSTELALDPNARTETVTDPTGRRVTVSTFDARGNVVTRDELYDGKTATSTFTYDAFDNVTTRTDPLGHTWTGTWDERDLTTFTAPGSQPVVINYDDHGFPTAWTQPGGPTTNYRWSPVTGNLDAIEDGIGNAETYGYTGADMTSRTDREGHTWRYEYVAGRLTKLTEPDPLNNATTYAYYDSGLLRDETPAAGPITHFEYWPDGQLKSRELRDRASGTPLGLKVSWTYNELGLLASRTDEAGFTTAWTYDLAGRVTRVDEPMGKQTRYAYYADGSLRTTTQENGTRDAVTTYAYDGAGRLETVTDPEGRTTRYEYDLAGRRVREINPAGGVTTNEYSDNGLLRLTRDPLNHETVRTYTPDGRIETVTDANDHATTFRYDPNGRLTAVIDAATGETLTGYDKIGQVVSTTNPEHETTTTDFDPAGRVSVVTDPLGHTTTHRYTAGRLSSIEDGLGHATSYAYDPAGRLATETSASGIATTYGYDPRGMVATVRDALGNTTTRTYNPLGLLATERDPRLNTTTFGYDLAGQLTTITDPLTHTVTLGYDRAGQQTTITDALGKTWTTTYAALGGIERTTDPLNRSALRVYNDAGQLERLTDPRGVVVDYDYDPAGNLVSIDTPGEHVGYGYDALGRRTTMTDATGTTTWGYDGASRITQVAAPAGTIGYGYDDAGRRTSMTLPSGQVSYGYHDDNALASVTTGGATTAYAYELDGRPRTVSRPNGVTTTYGYDPAGRLTGVTHTRGGSTIAAYAYTLDANGNRRSLTTGGATETYTLDAANQLTGVTGPAGSTGYTYDAAGNRATMTRNGATTLYAYDDASQLTSAGSTLYTYDAAGNRTGAGSTTYAYDELGRLDTVTVGGVTTGYTLDGDGTRAGATTAGVTTPYLWDLAAPLAELVSDGSATYLHANGDLFATQASGSTSYPLADALGSIRAITDGAGTVTGSATYDPFGATISQTGTRSLLGFTGELTDASGLIDLRARLLDPGTGTFTQIDPRRPGAPGVTGYNPYTYAGSNPTTWTDPSGQFALVQRAETDAAMQPALRLIQGGLGRGIRLVLWKTAHLLAAALTCAVVCPAFAPNPPTEDPGPTPEPDSGPVGGPQPHPTPGSGTSTLPWPDPAEDVPAPDEDEDGCTNPSAGWIVYGEPRDGRFAVGANAKLVRGMPGGTAASKDPPGWVPRNEPPLQRGHLIAKQFGGSGDTLANLVTEFRTMNRGRMWDVERLIRAAVDACEVVHYSVIPNYEGTGDLPVKSVTVKAVGNRGLFIYESILNKP